MKPLELFVLQTAIVDSVATVKRIGGLTHIVFAEMRPGPDWGAEPEQVVCARIAIPNDRVQAVMRALAGGTAAQALLAPEDIDTEGLTAN